MRRLRTGLVTVVATLSLLVAACSSAPTAGVQPKSSSAGGIEIGVEGPLTGIYAAVGEGFVRGAQAAVNEINAQGGVLGRKIGTVSADDQNDPGDAVPSLNKLIDVNHIVGLDGPNSTVLPALTPILTQNHIPTMFQGGSSFFNTNTNQWLWRPSPSDSELGVAMAAYALAKGYKRAAVLITSAATAESLAQTIESVYKKNGGQIISSQTVQPSLTSYQSEVQAIISSKPQVIFTQLDPTTAAPVFTEFSQQGGGSLHFIGSDLTAGSDFISAVGAPVAHHLLVSIAGSTNGGPGGTSFVKYYKAEYHSAPLSGANYAYDGVMEIALAIELAGTTNPLKINPEIAKISDPNGTKVYNWAQALAAIRKKQPIQYLGAGGPSGFDRYHNATGSFSAFQSNDSGSEQVVGNVSVQQLQQATAGQLKVK